MTLKKYFEKMAKKPRVKAIGWTAPFKPWQKRQLLVYGGLLEREEPLDDGRIQYFKDMSRYN